MSNEILEKTVVTGSGASGIAYGGGGALAKEQSDRFIDYMWDATVIAQDARTIRMKSDTVDIDKIAVGSKLVSLATEATDTSSNKDATFTKVSIVTKKLRLDWELSSEALEDNIEGDNLEDHVARLMATQAGNDIEDLLINGDTLLSGDALYKSFDGFHKLALQGGRVVDAGGAAISKATFNSALKALPRVYKQRRNQLRFYTGSNLVQDYLYNLTSVGVGGSPEDIATSIIRGQVAGPQGAGGGTVPYAFGVPVVEVPLFDETLAGTYSGTSGNHGRVDLTFPNNRIVGVKREIVVHREYRAKKDTVEYTVYTRVGCNVENLDAYVIVKNVKIAA